jgi:adenylate cyclase
VAHPRPERKLSAVLAADVAGYSRLMGVDEETTLARLKEHRRELIDPKIEEHRGRIVKTTGDGMLVEFASVVDAVRCAVEAQRAMAERNAEIPEEERIEFRIGINVGDIIIDGDDIFGDGVNVASRLEGLAEPGGICVSGRVQEDVHGKLDIAFTDEGDRQLKNIARPVRVCRIQLVGKPTRAAPSLALPDKPSVAVLPFANMSGDPEQEYFADGVVEDIITGLSRIKWLFVIARNSSFSYKGKAVDVKQVGCELGVRYLLEGSVRKAGNRVRITGQLVDAQTGAHLWAERYDRSLDDIFALQDEITLAVLGAIEPTLRAAEIERVKRKRPGSLDAYDLVLRALPFVYTAMPEDAAKAMPLLEKALELEPGYAIAHAHLAWYLHQRFSRGGLRAEDRIAAIRHARAATTHGGDDATALAIAGFVIALDEHDGATALNLFDRALALSNSNVFALRCSAVTLAWMGRAEQAIERAQLALRLSPYDALSYLSYVALAQSYFHTGRFEAAAAAARSGIESNPRFSVPQALLAAALVRLGHTSEANAAAQRVLTLDPRFTIGGFSVTVGLAPVVYARFADAWREAGLPD